ncbi:MAG: NmrA/HSCARG family protein [Solirubrobacterales bacterium]|nr:NmrA/HSCARG family protein [Solirubrobacterales bacterium]
MSDIRPVIAVIGATGAQGGGVVRALVDGGAFRVRAITRTPDAYTGPADEVRGADTSDVDSLKAAFEGAHGVFAVSNFTDTGTDEVTQGRNAVEAAVSAGVSHFIWSTLPNVEELSAGKFDVPHFTNKAKVDELVRAAGFDAYTFVEAPFYFENFLTVLAPQPLQDGSTGWALPIPADARVIHAGSIADLGGVVAGAFDHPETVGSGEYLSSAAALVSFDDFAETLRGQGHSLATMQVPPEVYGGFYPGAGEIAQMMLFWTEHTYLGPEGEDAISAARAVATFAPTSFADWAAEHMPAVSS